MPIVVIARRTRPPRPQQARTTTEIESNRLVFDAWALRKRGVSIVHEAAQSEYAEITPSGDKSEHMGAGQLVFSSR